MKLWATDDGNPGVEFDDHDAELARAVRDTAKSVERLADVSGILTERGECIRCENTRRTRPYPIVNQETATASLEELCAECQAEVAQADLNSLAEQGDDPIPEDNRSEDERIADAIQEAEGDGA